jgi:hypothetical protein
LMPAPITRRSYCEVEAGIDGGLLRACGPF